MKFIIIIDFITNYVIEVKLNCGYVEASVAFKWVMSLISKMNSRTTSD